MRLGVAALMRTGQVDSRSCLPLAAGQVSREDDRKQAFTKSGDVRGGGREQQQREGVGIPAREL